MITGDYCSKECSMLLRTSQGNYCEFYEKVLDVVDNKILRCKEYQQDDTND